MGKCFLHGNGSAVLNFKVVAYANEEELLAAKPRDNTIGIITDKKITGYYLCSAKPENMAEGEIWISTGTFSPVEFNAVKKNCVMIYPVAVWQSVGGELVNKTAKIYQKDVWKDTILLLMDSTLDNASNFSFTYYASNNSGLSLDSNGFYSKTDTADFSYRSFCTNDPVDLTAYKTLKMELRVSSGGDVWNFGVGAAKFGNVPMGNNQPTTFWKPTENVVDIQVVPIDISALSGLYYVGGITIAQSAHEVQVYRIWLE